MKDEIKEILDKFDKVLENYELDKKWGQMSVDSICHLFPSEMMVIKDCITNLQEENKCLKGNCKRYHKKSNNQAEEINRLYKQREKFMKKYGYLQEENEKLKQLCDKYEEEHSTTFNEWKETITDKYQTLKELQQENEKLENDKRGMLVQLYKANDEKDNYKSRNEKAIRYIERCRDYHRDIHKEERIFPDEITSLLMILNGGDEEC